MISVLLAVALFGTNLDKVRFSNIKFEPRENWVVAQSTPEMVLRPKNEIVKDQARITITAAAPLTGTLEQARDAAWTAALAGRSVNGEADKQDEQDVEGGGKMLLMGAAISPKGGAVVAVIKAGNKVTKLVLAADTDLAYQLTVALAGGLLTSLEVVDDAQPIGGGGVAGGPAPLGPDPSDSFDWDGPDWFEYGIYDHDCRDLETEFNELVRNNGGLIGVVKPRATTYAAALANARKLLSDPKAKAQFDNATNADSKKYPKLFVAGAAARMMDGDPFGALAHMLAGISAAPSDPDIMFNLASVLSQVGMPNESMAVLKQLGESGKKPQLSIGLKADAAMSYLSGYNQMLLGNLAAAATKLRGAIASDPFLSEANLCLALLQARQGGDGKKTYEQAAFRFKPTKLLFCSSGGEAKRPPVDEMFDTSKGARAVLSDFRHPKNWEDLLKWMGTFAPKRAKEIIAGQQALQARVSANPYPIDTDTPYGMWATKTTSLMEGLDENEPLLLKMQEIVDASEKDLQNAAEIHVGRLFKANLALIQAGVQHLCPEVKNNINQCLNMMRPYFVHWETVQRRYAQAWYRMATGVCAHLGKSRWLDAAKASLAMQIQGMDDMIFMSIHTAYGGMATQLAMIEEKCLADGVADGTSGTSPEGPECPAGMKGLGFKYAFDLGGGTGTRPKLGFKIDCEKFTVEIEYPLAKVGSGPLAEFGVGGFAQLEMSHKGDWSVFAGAKGSISSSGFGVSEKAGIYVKGNAREGIKDMGGRVSVDASGKGSEFSVSKSDSMDFSIMPSPKAPALGPGLRAFPNR